MKALIFTLAILLASGTLCAEEKEKVHHDGAQVVEHDAHDEGGAHFDHHHAVYLFLALSLMVLAGRAGALVTKVGLPAVVGELGAGMLVANVPRMLGVDLTGSLMGDFSVFVVMQIGVNLLLFSTGLEEELVRMLRVGPRAVGVAIIGVVLPYAGGHAAAMFYWPDAGLVTHAFVGATLVATSVGITAAIFANLGYKSPTRTLVIGSAVVDDVIGLVVLAVVSAMAAGAAVTPTMVGGKVVTAAMFLGVSVGIGVVLAPAIGRALSFVHPGVHMKQAMALSFCAVYAYAAYAFAGLEPIVGAFAAGLLLAPTHFRWFDKPFQAQRIEAWLDRVNGDEHADLKEEMRKVLHEKEHSHVEGLIQDFVKFFVPIYFVGTGMQVDLSVFLDVQVLLVAGIFTLIAIAGKLPCGMLAGRECNGWIVGWSMVARGEVGLVFANIGLQVGVFTPQIFAVLVVVVTLTTFIPPIFLPGLIRRDLEKLAAKT